MPTELHLAQLHAQRGGRMRCVSGQLITVHKGQIPLLARRLLAPTAFWPFLANAKVGPRRVGRPEFRVFFFLSWGPFVEFWWCLKRQDPQMCTFGLSGCRVKPRAVRRRGIPAERPRPTKILNTAPHRHTTPHNTTQHNTAQHHTSPHNLHREVLGRGSCAGWSWARLMAKKQDHEQQLSGRAAPLAKVSWAQGWFDQKKKSSLSHKDVK